LGAAAFSPRVHTGNLAVPASVERFKIVAATQGEQRRQRSALSQQKAMLEDKLQEKEALASTQGEKIKQLEGIRDKLHSEREAVKRKTKHASEGLCAAGQG